MSVILQNIPGTNASNNHTSYFSNTVGCANGIGCVGLNVCGQKGGNKKKETRKKHCSRNVKRCSKGGVRDLCLLLHNPDSNIVIFPGDAHNYCKQITRDPNYMCATNGKCMTKDDIIMLASERPDIIGGNKKKRTRKSKTRKRKTRKRKTRKRKTRKTRKH